MSTEDTSTIPMFPETPPEVSCTDIGLEEIFVDSPMEPGGKLVAHIDKYGVLQPIVVRAVTSYDNDGNAAHGYAIIDGRRRVLACRKLEHQTIPAFVVETEAQLDHVMTLGLHGTRERNPIAEFIAVDALMNEHQVPEGTIAQATGIPVGTIRQLLRMRNLIDDLREGFIAGRLSKSVAVAASALSDDQQAELAEQLAENGKVTMGDVRAQKEVNLSDATSQIDFGDMTDDPPIEYAELTDYALELMGDAFNDADRSAFPGWEVSDITAGPGTLVVRIAEVDGDRMARLTVKLEGLEDVSERSAG